MYSTDLAVTQWAVLAATPFFSGRECNLCAGADQVRIFFKKPGIRRFSDRCRKPIQKVFVAMSVKRAFLAVRLTDRPVQFGQFLLRGPVDVTLETPTECSK